MKQFLKSLVIPVLVAFIAAGAANASFWQWSKISANNATADATINWAEGMSPSSVNDSARAMMARAAEYRDDISGLLATAGTSTAYTVTTNQGLNAVPNDGQLLAITVNATNGPAPSLTADGGTTYPIQTSSGVAVSSGVLVAGTPYTVKFSSANSAWMLRDFYGNPFGIAIGMLVPTLNSVVPNSSFIIPAGQCISRTTYATFFAMVGTRFSVCDGSTTFGAPDLRGKVIAGNDNLGGSFAGNLTSTYCSGANTGTIGVSCGVDHYTLTNAQLPVTNLAFTGTAMTAGLSSLANALASTGVRMQAGASSFGGEVIGSGQRTDSFTPAGTISSFGGGGAYSSVQPVMVMTMLLRVI